jgi:hypothetical protein
MTNLDVIFWRGYSFNILGNFGIILIVWYLGAMQMQHIALAVSARVCRLKYPHE